MGSLISQDDDQRYVSHLIRYITSVIEHQYSCCELTPNMPQIKLEDAINSSFDYVIVGMIFTFPAKALN